MPKTKLPPAHVYSRGSCRIVVNYAQGYVCETTPERCVMTKFSALKRLTPAMVERAALAWGYTREGAMR